MADAKPLNERDTKLVQWLNEAHAKEAELEADLTAHIALTEKQLQETPAPAPTETREHKRPVASRIKKLGGSPSRRRAFRACPSAVGEVAGKAVAAVKGQVGTARAAITSQTETHLRNAQEELREEHVEIALYSRIETFATEVGDRETAQLAKRDPPRRGADGQVPRRRAQRLVKDVVRAEVPRDQRATPKRRTTSRRTSTSSRAAGASAVRSGAAASRPASASRSRSRGSTNGSSRSTARSRAGSSS